MILKDNVQIRGVFSIKAYKKDGSIEEYIENPNLIMDTARTNMAELVGGYSSGVPIDKFTLGNKGHNGTDILDYKKVGANDEFISTRTMLFSEDSNYDNTNDKDSFVYEISFDAKSDNISKVDDNASGSIKGSSDVQTCEVQRIITDRTCTYTITVPEPAGNNVGEGAVVAYTEAALYAGTKIFSMKTFPARVKEDSVKLVIKWAIIF